MDTTGVSLSWWTDLGCAPCHCDWCGGREWRPQFGGFHTKCDSGQSETVDGGRFCDTVCASFSNRLSRFVKQYETSETREMLSMVSSGTYDSVLAEVKGASDGYPLYGEVELESGQSLFTQLNKDTVVVQRSILKRLNLSVGDTLSVNGKTFTIADVVLSESDRVNVGGCRTQSVSVYGGTRPNKNWIQFGSRVTRRIQWKVGEEGKSELLETLNKLEETHSFVSTQSATRSNPSTARSINNSERFWGCGADVALIGTIGVVQSLSNWLVSRRKEMAIFRCLGMSRGGRYYRFM